ncbi:probable dolichyl-diphosphooligosaccharide--protein glycosyltransferase subunit 3B [Nymphaea colorata]|uniref:Dolichyl-diphosphooligosaccharide--protein glycosyltransferase subunit 3B n=1 Tax=Nymphaea colorata TaxID=210225 RepID=A0A5K0W2H0_9MAGN|nr:probable dolichyl-diphosphooligosaccharide--protein glycosyltransferase subunit 3B [Nymphaea colorata]
MARPFVLLFLLSLISIFPSKISPESPADLVADLLALQQRSPSGVIRLDDHAIRRFLLGPPTPRPYSLLIFFDATQLHDKPELRLQQLRSEFALVASSFIKNNQGQDSETQLFFCDLEFKESQTSFGLFGVNALPHIRVVLPHVRKLADSDSMDQVDFSRLAEGISDFVEAKAKLSVGPIERPPPISKTQMMILVLILLVSAPFVVKRVLEGDTLLHEPKMWLAGAVFVYFFSVSGTMHNIIRNMPMFIADRSDPSKLIFFYQGSGMQLGVEGFAVGFLYTIVGVLLALVTHVLIYARNANLQRAGMFVAMLVSIWAVRKVIYLDNWKTGYAIHSYWPSPRR